MTSKDEAARILAEKHFEAEEGMARIFRIRAAAEAEARESEPIKLLEVNAATVVAGIMPLHFGASPSVGVHYPSVIIEVTPEEYERIAGAQLGLPDGWTIGEELHQASAVGAGSK